MPKKRTKKGWVHINTRELEDMVQKEHDPLRYLPDAYDLTEVKTNEDPNTWIPAWHTGCGWYGRRLNPYETVKIWKKV